MTPAPVQPQFAFSSITNPVQIPKHAGFYTSFNRAVDLSHCIGVPATTENLKQLELHERVTDPHPLKKRAPLDEEVSLYSVDDVNIFMDNSANATSRNTHRLVRGYVFDYDADYQLPLDSK